MPQLQGQWTVDDVWALPDDGNRYEVIDGELFVTPAPSWSHQTAAGRLFSLIDAYLQMEQVGFVFIAPADVTFSTRRNVQPDVFIVPTVGGKRPRAFGQVKQLLLAAEVLSPSTTRADRVSKRALFRDEGVAEYWIVNTEDRVFERFTPASKRAEIHATDITWHPHGAESSLNIDLPAYFRSVLDD